MHSDKVKRAVAKLEKKEIGNKRETGAVIKKPEVKRMTQKEVLLANADEVIEMIRQAKTYEDIQDRFCVHAKYLVDFITNSEYSARAREAQKQSAEMIAAKAEKVLLQIQADDTQASVTRQRELAHHYRWLAAKKNPKEYGDRQTIAGDAEAPLFPKLEIILN